MSEGLDNAYKIIHNQQLYLETLDNKERRCNLVITGLSEDPDEIGANNSEKVVKVLQTAGYADAVEPTRWEMRRLGQANERRKRPLLSLRWRVSRGETPFYA